MKQVKSFKTKLKVPFKCLHKCLSLRLSLNFGSLRLPASSSTEGTVWAKWYQPLKLAYALAIEIVKYLVDCVLV